MDIGPEGVIISPPSSAIAIVGMNFTLSCSVNITPFPLPENASLPTFKWFFGPDSPLILPYVICSNYAHNGTYTSTIQFTPLQASHEGWYTCQLGGNERLAYVTSLTLEGILSTSYLLVNNTVVIIIIVSRVLN